MTVLADTENRHLAAALEQAREFLALHPLQRAASRWYLNLREDRDSRNFFNGDPLRRTTSFGVKVAEQVAKAYLACEGARDEEAAPTGRRVKAIRDKASALKAELESSGPWVIAARDSSAFREPPHQLATNASRVPPRTAGR